MSRVRLARIFWIGAAAILVATALVALAAVLRGDFSDTDGRILGTLGAALLAGSAAIAGLALGERGGRLLGWSTVAVSGPAFAALVYAIWDGVSDGGGDSWRWGWLGSLALLAALIAVSSRLLARGRRVIQLAHAAGVLAVLAAAATAAAIWTEDPGDTYGRVIAVLWILTGLAYLLVPVLQRFSASGRPADEERVLAELDGVELVVVRSGPGVRADLAPGERLLLRRRG